MTFRLRELLAGPVPPEPFPVNLPKAPADGTEVRQRVPLKYPLQLIAGDGDALLAPGGPTSVTLTFPGEVLRLRYRQPDQTWYALSTIGETP